MKTIIITLLVFFIMIGAVLYLEEDNVQIEEIKLSFPKDEKRVREIPVRVTLTKFQLKKMLSILENDNQLILLNGEISPALDQDVYTFRAMAKGSTGEYQISSTQLSKNSK
tara:strand:- start:506 stop:838 length:333 start_codon:yes stop_codon:yes gene_type:complete